MKFRPGTDPASPVRSFAACGVRIDAASLDRATEILTSHPGPMAVHLCTAHTLSLTRSEDGWSDLLNRADLNLPDGKPLAVLAKLRGASENTARTYGPELMEHTLDRGREKGTRHFLYGATPETLARLKAAINRRYPGAEIAGSHSPPFRPLTTAERSELIEEIHSSNADIVWVGLGTPKQDHFVDEFRDDLGIPLVAVGAAFDFLAGKKARAPRLIQNAGLEWAFRLATEPRRLWKRYLVGNATFVFSLLKHWNHDRRLSPFGFRGPTVESRKPSL